MENLAYENALEAVSDEPMDTLASLANDMVYRLPGCPDVTIRLMLQNAWREFCQKTGALRFKCVCRAVTGWRVYHIALPFKASVVRAENVCFSGMSDPWVAPLRLGVDYALKQGTPPAIVVERSVPPISNRDDRGAFLVATVVCLPARGCEDIPSGLLGLYSDAIVHGALFRLYAMKGRAWADEQQSMLEGRAFESAMNNAALDASNGNVSGTNPIGWP